MTKQQQPISWYAVVLLTGHIILAGVAAWSLWVVGGGLWLGAAAALVLIVWHGLLWRLRLAPAAHKRFAYKERATVHVILGTAIIVLAVLAGPWLAAVVGGSMVLLGDALAVRSVDSQ